MLCNILRIISWCVNTCAYCSAAKCQPDGLGDLPDYVPEEPFAKAFGIRQTQSFSSLLTQLRKAKVDNRIGGVLLDINFPGIGWGKADELRDAIVECE